MDANSLYFISLITAFLKGDKPVKPSCMMGSGAKRDNQTDYMADGEVKANDHLVCTKSIEVKRNDQQVVVDWEKIYNLARIHSLGGTVYLALQKLEKKDRPEPSILNKFKSDFFYATCRYEQQQKAYGEIVQLLNEHNIKHVFFKGVVIREYYPVRQMRTQGDIDLLIQKEDAEKVRKIFADLGYKDLSSKWHDKYRKGKIVFEVHDKMINTKINSKIDYFEYFKNAWNYTIPKENTCTFELDINYHLVFLIAHIAKHFYKIGAGVRMILDIAVVVDKFGDMLDYQKIWNELKEIKLDIFAEHIFYLCEKWFDVKTPGVVFDKDELTINAMSKYVLEGGTFGFSNNNIAIETLRNEYSKTKKMKYIKLKAIFKKIFLDFDTMKEKYPILKKYAYLLVPAWIHRWIKCIIKKRRRTLRIIKGLCKCSKDGQNSYDMMKNIGL